MTDAGVKAEEGRPPTGSAGFSRASNWRISILVYLLLPNALFLVLGRFIYVERPVIDLDYLLLGSVAGLLPLSITVVAYLALLLDDILVTFAPVFHFSLENAVFALSYGMKLRGSILLLPVMIAICAATLAFLGVGFARHRQGRAFQPLLVLIAVAIFFVDVVGGTNRFGRRDRALLPVNVAISAGYKTVMAVYAGIIAGRGPVVAARMSGATGNLLTAVAEPGGSTNAMRSNVLFVLVESLGHSLEPGVDSIVFAPLLTDSIRSRYEIRAGTVPTKGTTTNAEFRELCGFDADYRKIERIDTSNCLPFLLRGRGYRSTSYHGYTSALFDRYRWYPLLGLDRSLFAADLVTLGASRACGRAFRGLCDADVAEVIRRQLVDPSKRGRQFVYWLTLNSHLPVDPTGGARSTLNCTDLPLDERHDDVCVLLRVQRLVTSSVARIASDPALPSTRIVIVGDHAPPFFSIAKRSLFAPDRVPFLELVPRVRL